LGSPRALGLNLADESRRPDDPSTGKGPGKARCLIRTKTGVEHPPVRSLAVERRVA
jgi:hypothetical protein